MDKIEKRKFWEEWWSWFGSVLGYTLLGWAIAFVTIAISHETGLIQSFRGWLSLTILVTVMALIILTVFGFMIFRVIKRRKSIKGRRKYEKRR